MSSKKGSFIVTGCNGGLGKAIVAEFLQSPHATLYKGQFGVRNPSTATSLQTLLAASPSSADHETITIDLSNLTSVRDSAKKINARVKSGEIPPIRALLLNAALQHAKGQTFTADGLESNFAVNYLANFLLVLLLLPSMDREVEARIVFTSSWTHDPAHPLNGHIKEGSHYTILRDPDELAKPKEDDSAGDEYNAGMRRYGMSKTLMVMWMYELQRRLSASRDFSHISVLAVDPGAVTDTDLFRDSPLTLRILLTWVSTPLTPLLNWIWPNGYFRTRAKSGHDLVRACFDERVLGEHPKALYLNGSEVAGTSAETRDEGKQRRLWEASVEISGVKDWESPLGLR